MEAATNGLFGHFEIRPGLGVAGVQFGQRLFHKVQSRASSVHLEVSACTVALDGVAPLGNLPLERDLRQRRGLRQIHLYAMASGFDVADVNQAGERGCPEARDGAAASVPCPAVARSFVEPARRHAPSVLAAEVALLRTRNRGL